MVFSGSSEAIQGSYEVLLVVVIFEGKYFRVIQWLSEAIIISISYINMKCVGTQPLSFEFIILRQ